MRRLPKQAWIAVAVLGFVLLVAWLTPPTKPLGGARVMPGARGLAPVDQPLPTSAPPTPAIVEAPSARNVAEPVPEPSEVGTDEIDDPRAFGAAVVGARDPDAGYRWAAQREVQDARECRQLGDGPGAEGCRAYAREAEARAEDREDEPF